MGRVHDAVERQLGKARREAEVAARARLGEHEPTGGDRTNGLCDLVVEGGEAVSLERAQRVRAPEWLVDRIEADDVVVLREPQSEPPPGLDEVTAHVGVRPERVEARADVGIEAAEKPRSRGLERGVARVVARPLRRPVAAEEALTVEILMHVDDDEQPGVTRPADALVDRLDVRVVVGAARGLECRPRDEEA